jgi:hypothetical protein
MNNLLSIVFVIAFLVFGFFVITIILGTNVALNSPYYTGEAKYYQTSVLDYPIYSSSIASVSKKTLYFDEYSISDNIVTVKGYWRLEGISWKKCYGSLSFKYDNFVPIKNEEQRTTVEIMSESCE